MLFLTSGDLFQNYLFLPSQMTYVKLSKVKIIPWYLLITISYSNILNCPKYAFYSCFAHIRSHLESLNASSCGLFSSDQSLSRVWLFATPWIAACQASLSITNSRSSPKPTSIESVMPSSHLILCRPLFFLPPIPPSIRVFSNDLFIYYLAPKTAH